MNISSEIITNSSQNEIEIRSVPTQSEEKPQPISEIKIPVGDNIDDDMDQSFNLGMGIGIAIGIAIGIVLFFILRQKPPK